MKQIKFSKKTQNMINKYYMDNKEVLDKAGYSKEMFEGNIKSLMKGNNVRAKTAIKIFRHKTDFTSKAQIEAENIVQAMKNFKYTEGHNESRYSDFRREVVGWKNKLDYNDFEEVNGKMVYHGELADVVFELKTGSAGSQYWTWTILN